MRHDACRQSKGENCERLFQLGDKQMQHIVFVHPYYSYRRLTCHTPSALQILLLQERNKPFVTKNYLRDLDDVQGIREPVNEICRSKMVEWVQMICDMCHLSRSIVPITFSYVDRLLSDTTNDKQEETIALLGDRDKYQLLVIVSFYIAVKINEQKVLSPDIFELLSRGRYTVQDIENEEQRILRALDWRLFGPNAFHFVYHFLAMISPAHPTIAANGNTPPAIDEITRRALGQVEASLAKQSFLDYKYSNVALAALRNAIDDVYIYCPLQDWTTNLEVCDILVGVDAYSEEVESVKVHLREMMLDCSGKSQKSSPSKLPCQENVQSLHVEENEIMATKPPPIIKKRDISSPTCVGRITVES